MLRMKFKRREQKPKSNTMPKLVAEAK